MTTNADPTTIANNRDDTEIAWEKFRDLHHTKLPVSGSRLRRLADAASLKGSLHP